MTRYDTRRRFPLEDALAALPGDQGEASAEVFRHGTLQVKLYAPRGEDTQTPHTRDEAYIVVRGTGTFVTEDKSRPFVAGDFLFAPAGAPHHFADFSDDFATWVLFYGPEGGE